MEKEIIAAIAAYLDNIEDLKLPEYKVLIPEIASEIAAAIAPLVEAVKPDWKDAPEWADHLAQDLHGQWHWFRGEPKPDGQYWLALKYYNQRAFTPNPNWKETLQKRPA